MDVTYQRTNESIHAILMGMDVKKTDRILAVGGSGDQSFAFLSKGVRKVIAVDISKNQTRYLRRQANLIKKGNYNKFLYNRGCPSKRGRSGDVTRWEIEEGMGTKFFSREMFDKARKNISSLTIKNTDILSAMEKENRFNKIYLSNALSYDSPHFRPASEFSYARSVLRKIAQDLPLGGLTYITENRAYERIVNWIEGIEIRRDLFFGPMEETWYPIVVERV